MDLPEDIVQAVWEKAQVVDGLDPDQWRKDECGAWIGRRYYAIRVAPYGWEIDRIAPDGPDTLDNLRPLQWENRLTRSAGGLACAVTAMGVANVQQQSECTVEASTARQFPNASDAETAREQTQ